jgi:hypothetical protein
MKNTEQSNQVRNEQCDEAEDTAQTSKLLEQ